MIIIVGTRTINTGADTPAYHLFYQICCTDGMEKRALNYFEPLFSLIGLLCAKLGLGFVVFNILIAALTMVFFSLAVTNLNVNVFLCVTLYTVFCYHLNMMNQVRQALAVTIVFYAITCLNKKRKSYFIIFVIIAALIHLSSLIALILLPIWNKNLSKRIAILYCVAGFVCIFFNKFIIQFAVNSFDYGHYLTETWRYGAFNLDAIMNFIVRVLMMAAVLLFYRELFEKDYNISGYYHMAIICTLTQLLCIFNNAFGRITTYFYFSYFCLIPTISENTILFKKNKAIMNIALFLALLIYYYVYLGSKSIEYHSVIFAGV